VVDQGRGRLPRKHRHLQTCRISTRHPQRARPISTSPARRRKAPGDSILMDSTQLQKQLVELKRKLAELAAETIRIEDEITALESDAVLKLETQGPAPPRTPAEKIALFLDLFGTRRSVYPKRWENGRTGRSGYSPACDNEWQPGICQKPRVTCTECPHQKFPSFDEKAVEAHLRGAHTLGVYAIATDGTCRFLAADFDGANWSADVLAYREAGHRIGITVAVERSRSGNGAHAWIFFAHPVPATIARRLGMILLAKASALRPALSLTAFDRLFPNQDTLPDGGFGNLIALPLAKASREHGNTLFLDADLQPLKDQWMFLAGLPRFSRVTLERTLARIAPVEPPPSIVQGVSGQPASEDFHLQSDSAILDLSQPRIRSGMLSGEVTLRLDAQIHLPRSLPPPVLAALRRLATFPNPIFHEKLRLRFATFDTPRFLFAGEWHADRLVLPRGVIDRCVNVLEAAGATVAVQDARDAGVRIPWKFEGELRAGQEKAVNAMLAEDQGVLCAPPGSGKTVMGCAMIARARTSALVLVHRAVLVDQWRDTAIRFLGQKRKEIGIWRGQAPRITHRLDIAMLPSVARTENFAAMLSGYGIIVVDECHHVPAASFEAILKVCPSRRVYGLTATPRRKDRLETLLFAQCGPIRHTLDEEPAVAARHVKVRATTIALPDGSSERASLHELWDALVRDDGRIGVIAADLASCVTARRSALVLADRKAYLERLEQRFASMAPEVPLFCLDGLLGKKARKEVLRKINEHFSESRPFVLFATASLVGEGFDLPQLDTLVLAMPLSFKGRLVQYAGRLHRSHEAKRDVVIFDYLDENHAITQAMFRRRLAGYREMGYNVEMPGEETPMGL